MTVGEGSNMAHVHVCFVCCCQMQLNAIFILFTDNAQRETPFQPQRCQRSDPRMCVNGLQLIFITFQPWSWHIFTGPQAAQWWVRLKKKKKYSVSRDLTSSEEGLEVSSILSNRMVCSYCNSGIAQDQQANEPQSHNVPKGFKKYEVHLLQT